MKLEEWEMICPMCEGNGVISALIEYPDGLRMNMDELCCPRCMGRKKIDWLEKIKGEKFETLKVRGMQTKCK